MFSILAILWICFNLWSTNPLNPPSLSALRLLSLIRGTYSLRSPITFHLIPFPLNLPPFPFPLKPFTFPLIPFLKSHPAEQQETRLRFATTHQLYGIPTTHQQNQPRQQLQSAYLHRNLQHIRSALLSPQPTE